MLLGLGLLACAGGVLGDGSRTATEFLPPWAAETHFRPVEALDATDTAAFMGEVWSAQVTGGGPWRWVVYDGEDPGTSPELLAFDFEGSGDLALVDPPLTLLPARFDSGEQVAEGTTNVTVRVLKGVVTWYGVLPEVVEIEMIGALTGTLRIAPGIGPVQFELSGDAADLAWYR